jgi:hypothetical protein
VSGSSPWWYSGDNVENASGESAGSEPDADQGPEEGQEGAADAGARDWAGLVSGAQRVVDWATERLLAPHAEHVDPRDHPDCVLCRTMSVLGDVGLRPASGGDTAAGDDSSGATGEQEPSDDPIGPVQRPVIHWIPIRGESPDP